MTLNAKSAGEKRKYNPCLSTDTVLWWLRTTTEVNLAPSGFNTCIDYSRFDKKKTTTKTKAEAKAEAKAKAKAKAKTKAKEKAKAKAKKTKTKSKNNTSVRRGTKG